MIKTEFGFFRMQQKLPGPQAVKLLPSTFGKRSEAFDAVSMIRSVGKPIRAVIDTKMFGKTGIDKSVKVS